MGRQIVKVARDRDLYMEWSSVVEAPTRLGTRAEFLEYLNEPRRGEEWSTEAAIESRLVRADETGSSGFAPFGCSWTDRGEIYQQQGFLPRGRFSEFADRWLASKGDDLPDISDLLEPFED